MKSLVFSRIPDRWLAGLLLISLLLTGCASGPRVDWNSRIGNFTFDQAVVELGPPDKSAKLTDGTLVAEWLSARGYSRPHFYLHSGVGYHRHYASTFWIEDYDTYPSPNWYLRLTFGTDSKLTAWKRIVK